MPLPRTILFLAIPDKRVSVFSAKNYKLNKDKFEQIEKDAVAYDGHMKSENLTQTLIDESLQPKPAVSKEFDERLGIYTVKFENGATLEIFLQLGILLLTSKVTQCQYHVDCMYLEFFHVYKSQFFIYYFLSKYLITNLLIQDYVIYTSGACE